MSETITLLPCPFCGGDAAFERLGNSRQSCVVSCNDCGCRMESNETWNFGSAWNTRTVSASLDWLEAKLAKAREDALREGIAKIASRFAIYSDNGQSIKAMGFSEAAEELESLIEKDKGSD